MAADLTNLGGHDALIARSVEEFGGVFVLANVAAVLRRQRSLDEITEDDWDYHLYVNLKGAFLPVPGSWSGDDQGR